MRPGGRVRETGVELSCGIGETFPGTPGSASVRRYESRPPSPA